jgi:fucose permease
MTDIPKQPSGETARAAVFFTGIASLFVAGFSLALRAAIAGGLKRAYLDPLDLGRSATMISEALGLAFLGFTIMLGVSSVLLDKIGMKRMLLFASAMYVLATALIVSCGAFAQGQAVYWQICAGMFINGLAHGATEGTINPMVGALYPSDSTHRMNILHAWYPAGLIAGGLLGGFSGALAFAPQILFLAVGVIGAGFGVAALFITFPPTSSRALQISVVEQFQELCRRPSFWVWFFLMLFTSATELAPGQWIDVALTNVVGMRGILLLVYVAAIQFVGRHFAGPLERRVSTEGLLTGSCVLAALGLFMLSRAYSPLTAIIASTAWGFGVCYLWPTMVAVAAARYPRGGVMAIGLIGMAGAISSYFILPILGSVYDNAELAAAGGPQALATLGPERLHAVLVYAARQSFRVVAVIPAILVIVFPILYAMRRRSGAAS